MSQQQRNKRNTYQITFKNETRPLIEWSEQLGINYGTLYSRLKRSHWSVKKALTNS